MHYVWTVSVVQTAFYDDMILFNLTQITFIHDLEMQDLRASVGVLMLMLGEDISDLAWQW